MRMWVDPVGLYRPLDTVVHRAPVALRFGGLAALGVALAVLRGPVSAAVGLGVVAAVAVLARLPARTTLYGLAPVVVMGGFAVAYHAWQGTLHLGVEAAGDLLAVVLAATVVTATTPTDVLLDLLTRAARPLRHLGLRPESFSLAVALMLRTIPAIGALVVEVRDAARARGVERSPRAILVPAAVRTVGRARAVGEALAARGIGE